MISKETLEIMDSLWAISFLDKIWSALYIVLIPELIQGFLLFIIISCKILFILQILISKRSEFFLLTLVDDKTFYCIEWIKILYSSDVH